MFLANFVDFADSGDFDDFISLPHIFLMAPSLADFAPCSLFTYVNPKFKEIWKIVMKLNIEFGENQRVFR